MAGVHGVWKNKAAASVPAPTIVHTIREDLSYETHMTFPMGEGCTQHIYHNGTIEIGDTTLRLGFETGKTEMTGCDDGTRNFSLRDFTQAESDETAQMLGRDIEYKLDGDTLTTTVQGPMGKISVEYTRQAAS